MDDTDSFAMLLSEVENAIAPTEQAARYWDRLNRILWWLGVGVSAAGVILGYVGNLAKAHSIDPWMVSAIVSAGGAIEILRRRTGWEPLGSAYWAKTVDLTELARKMRFQIEGRPKSDPLRIAVEDLTDLEDRFGTAIDKAIIERERPTKH